MQIRVQSQCLRRDIYKQFQIFRYFGSNLLSIVSRISIFHEICFSQAADEILKCGDHLVLYFTWLFFTLNYQFFNRFVVDFFFCKSFTFHIDIRNFYFQKKKRKRRKRCLCAHCWNTLGWNWICVYGKQECTYAFLKKKAVRSAIFVWKSSNSSEEREYRRWERKWSICLVTQNRLFNVHRMLFLVERNSFHWQMSLHYFQTFVLFSVLNWIPKFVWTLNRWCLENYRFLYCLYNRLRIVCHKNCK